MAGEANDNAQFQDALSQLFGRLQDPNQAPSPTMQPGYPGGPPNPANLPINARAPQVPYQNASHPLPALPPMPPPAVASPATRPTPSDDPAVTMPTLPTVPSFRAPTQLNNRIATRTAIDDVNASHANDARDNRPHWYDRLLGGVTGALVGGVTGNEKQGAAVGGQVTNRAFNRQDQERQRQLSPLFNHLNAEKEDEPFYANADKSDQTSFEDKKQNAVEERNQITSQQKNEIAGQLADIKQQVSDNKHDEALDKIKQLQAQLDEKSQHNQDWMQVQHQLLDLKRDALDLKEKQGGKGNTKKYDTIQKDKAAAESRADREYNTEMQSITDKNSPEAQTAAQNKTAKYRAAQANYEQRIEGQGGEPDHIEYDENGVARNNSGNPVGPAGGASTAQPGSAAPTAAQVEDHILTKPAKPGTKLTDPKIAKQYLAAAKGDKAKARELAKSDGWNF